MLTEAQRQYQREYRRRRCSEDPEFRERKKRLSKEHHEKNRDRINARHRERRTYLRLVAPWLSHYRAAKERCTNSGCVNYKYYGGKGIRMLLTKLEIEILWKRDRADLMERPSMDRINPRGDYHFGNCRFIEQSENCKRTR